MRAIAFAYSGFGHVGVQALLRAGFELPLVVSHHDQPGENRWWPSVSALCAEAGVRTSFDPDLRAADTVAELAALRPDVIFSFYFRRMIPGRILRLAARGAYNLHGSLLPRYRGRAPLNWQLVHGETTTGLTLHRMVLSADAGAIVAQQAFAVGPDEDAFAVVQRLLAAAPPFLDRALADLGAGRAEQREQDHALATVFSGRTPADGAIDWRWPARRVHNLVRAVSRPFPGAFADLDGQRALIWKTRIAADHGPGEPGLVRADGLVACGDGLIEILDAEDLAGAPLRPRPGQRFSPADLIPATPEHP